MVVLTRHESTQTQAGVWGAGCSFLWSLVDARTAQMYT